MLKNIIVTLDGSKFGEQALPMALALAERDQADIELVHVFEAMPPYRAVQGAPVFDSELDAELAKDRSAYLETIAGWVRQRTRVKVTSSVLVGRVKDVLPDHIETRSPDVVVMTTHGRGGLSRLWLGSTAMNLVRKVTVPLLLIRPGKERTREEPAREIRRVLVPLDARPESEEAINNALQVAGDKGVEFVLMHVLVPIVYVAPDAAIGTVYPSEAQLLAAAEEYVSRVADRLHARGLKVETRIEWNTFPAHAILEVAEALSVDLISMATEAARGVERLLLGSVADKVVRAAHVPVLLQRPE